MGFWSLLVGSLVKPQDPFPQRVRKGVVAIFFFPTVLLWLGYAANDMMIATNAWRYTAPIAMLLLSTISAISYFAMRKHSEVGDSHFSFVMWSLGILMFLIMLCHPEADNKTPIAIWLGIAVQTGLPKIYWYFGFVFLLSLLPDWNTAFIREPDMQVLIPGSARNGNPYTLYVGRVLATLVYMLCCVVAKQQGDSAEKQRLAQAAANKMTLRVLQSQRKYDTEEITCILEECAEEKLVDPELIKLFEEMNQNLEEYRPFLPNYLFQDSDAATSAAEGEETKSKEGGEEELHAVSVNESLQSSGLSYGDVDGRSTTSEMNPLEADEPPKLHGHPTSSVLPAGRPPSSQRPGSPGRRQAEQPAQHFNVVISFAVVDIQLDRLMTALSSCPVATTGSLPAARQQHHPEQLWKNESPLISSLISSDISSPVSADVSATHAKGAQLGVLVEMIHSLAKQTKASVHSLVGDTVQLSWNATHTICLPDTKGALFLTTLRKMIAGAAGQKTEINATQPCIAGAVCSGEATVHSIISTTHQRSLVIDAPWLPALTGCFDLAKRHGAMLMDERTARGANLTVAGVAVEKLFYRTQSFASEQQEIEEGHSSSRPYHFLFADANQGKENSALMGGSPASATLVYQLLDEKTRQENLEWMYQLDSNSGEQKQTLAQMQQTLIESYADGRHDDVVKMLEASSKSYVSSPISPSPPSESFGGGDGSPAVVKKTPAELCLPSFRAAMMASVTRSRGMISKSVPSAMGSTTATSATTRKTSSV